MAAQPALSLGSLEAVLSEAAMSLANLVRLGVAPTTTLLGVTRPAAPGRMAESEGTAVA